jgi:type IV secretory pathway VirB2 component (pilin)
MSMVKKMRKMTGRLVELVTGKRLMTMAGLALVSNALAYASTSTTGLPWETPLQTVQQSLTGPVAAGISVVGIALAAWRWYLAANYLNLPNGPATR